MNLFAQNKKCKKSHPKVVKHYFFQRHNEGKLQSLDGFESEILLQNAE